MEIGRPIRQVSLEECPHFDDELRPKWNSKTAGRLIDYLNGIVTCGCLCPKHLPHSQVVLSQLLSTLELQLRLERGHCSDSSSTVIPIILCALRQLKIIRRCQLCANSVPLQRIHANDPQSRQHSIDNAMNNEQLTGATDVSFVSVSRCQASSCRAPSRGLPINKAACCRWWLRLHRDWNVAGKIPVHDGDLKHLNLADDDCSPKTNVQQFSIKTNDKTGDRKNDSGTEQRNTSTTASQTPRSANPVFGRCLGNSYTLLLIPDENLLAHPTDPSPAPSSEQSQVWGLTEAPPSDKMDSKIANNHSSFLKPSDVFPSSRRPTNPSQHVINTLDFLSSISPKMSVIPPPNRYPFSKNEQSSLN
ncbi:unnamed protein product [Dicrocoelium dendriticum]|nr:unnamed protein product [Dicrocoelium dendriticum]